jgi:hypothetical protein
LAPWLRIFQAKSFPSKEKKVKYSLPILKSKVALFMKKVVGIRMQVEHGIKKKTRTMVNRSKAQGKP